MSIDYAKICPTCPHRIPCDNGCAPVDNPELPCQAENDRIPSTAQAPRTSDTDKALDEFVTAAQNLLEVWEKNHTTTDLGKGYPFAASFDEIVLSLMIWRDKVKGTE